MTDIPQSFPESEFSRPIEAASLIHGESKKSYTASPQEREDLAKRFSLASLKVLTATLTIQRSGSGRRLKVQVNGQLRAEIEQICVVSLETFSSKIKTAFETVFDNHSDAAIDQVDLDVADDDPAEAVIDGFIDMGELISQSLGLEIDLHPRKPGVESEFDVSQKANHADIKAEKRAESPFAVLQNLKIKPKN